MGSNPTRGTESRQGSYREGSVKPPDDPTCRLRHLSPEPSGYYSQVFLVAQSGRALAPGRWGVREVAGSNPAEEATARMHGVGGDLRTICRSGSMKHIPRRFPHGDHLAPCLIHTCGGHRGVLPHTPLCRNPPWRNWHDAPASKVGALNWACGFESHRGDRRGNSGERTPDVTSLHTLLWSGRGH